MGCAQKERERESRVEGERPRSWGERRGSGVDCACVRLFEFVCVFCFVFPTRSVLILKFFFVYREKRNVVSSMICCFLSFDVILAFSCLFFVCFFFFLGSFFFALFVPLLASYTMKVDYVSC